MKKQIFLRFIPAILLILCWNSWNQHQIIPATYSIFPVAAILFFAAAWFRYLKMDGVQRPFSKPKTTKPTIQQPVGFRDTVNQEPLEDSDKPLDLRPLLADIICGMIFLLLSFL